MTSMALLTGFTNAYRAERAIPRARKPHTPVLAHLGAALGRHTPRWPAVRTFTLTAGGLGLMDTAAFQCAPWAGLAATGLSALILDWKLGE